MLPIKKSRGWSNESYEDDEVTSKQAKADADVHYALSVEEIVFVTITLSRGGAAR